MYHLTLVSGVLIIFIIYLTVFVIAAFPFNEYENHLKADIYLHEKS